MSGPTPMAIRQEIVRRYKQGEPISSISRQLQVSRGTIYALITRFDSSGDEGLKPSYRNCGKKRPSSNDFIFRAVRCLRCWHPSWGAEKIHAELLMMRPDLELPHVRTMYRWFQWNEQTLPATKLPKEPRPWAGQVHEGWQIDAKEEMKTADGGKQCWLNITDECSGTIIDPPVFPPQENLRGSSDRGSASFD